MVGNGDDLRSLPLIERKFVDGFRHLGLSFIHNVFCHKTFTSFRNCNQSTALLPKWGAPSGSSSTWRSSASYSSCQQVHWNGGELGYLLAVFFIGTVISVVSLSRGNKGLLEERLKPPVQKGQPLADKIVLLLLLATFFGLMVFIPLDVFHFHLMGRPGTIVSSLGLVPFVAGWWVA